MEKLLISSRLKNEIINLFLRGMAGFFPVLFAFLLPLVNNNNYSSDFFSKYSLIIILSALLRFGFDQKILKTNISLLNFFNFLYTTFIIHFISGIILLYIFNIQFYSLIAIFSFSVNALVTSYKISKDKKNQALIIQFVFPNILMLILAYHNYDINFIISVSYGLISFFSLFNEFFKLNIIRFIRKLKFTILVDNYYLSIYNLFNILISNFPIILSSYFLQDVDVIWVNQTIKIIGISSFISSILIFNFNNRLRSMDFKIISKYIIYLFAPLIILYFLSIYILIHFIDLFFFDQFYYFIIISIILSIITIGNISGHFWILKSKEKVIIYSLVFSSILVCLPLILFAKINKVLIVFSYISILLLDSILKQYKFWKSQLFR